MDLGLKDKVALVTGASRGLGLAAASALAQEGAFIAVCSRSKSNLEKAVAQLKADSGLSESGSHPLAVVADMTQADQIRALVGQVVRKLGPPRILVTNTGGPPSGGFDDIDDETWEASFRLTALSVIRVIREVAPHMKAAGRGRIVNIQSRSVKEPIDGLLTSNAIRPGVIGLAKSLAAELGPHGITVNNVLPGYIRTERLEELAAVKAGKEGVTTGEVFKAWGDDNPLGRIGKPEEVGALAAFLASERASFINGVSVLVDGGGVKSLF